MAGLVDLQDRLAALVRDGDAVALEGFTHSIPFAAGHQLLRQGRRDLELIRMTPDILYDQMVGAGARVTGFRDGGERAAVRSARHGLARVDAGTTPSDAN